MKFVRLELENFQSATELSLDFATDDEKKLTVIRAENGFGKTTLHAAFRWAVFGKDGLNKDKRGIEKISHFDLATEEGQPVQIKVKLRFSTDSKRGDNLYEIQRVAKVNVKKEQDANGDWLTKEDRIGAERVDLLALENGNWNRLDSTEARIATFFPLRTKDVFFVDGDQLNELIQVDNQSRMFKVQNSIDYLLQLDRIGNAIDNINKVRQAFAKKNKKTTSGDLNLVLQNIEDTETIIELDEKELEDIIEKKQIENIAFSAAYNAYKDAVRSGDARVLNDEKDILTDEKDSLVIDINRNELELRKLIGDNSLFSNLLGGELIKAKKKLEKEKKDGRFPKDAIAVIKELLTKDECLCGEKLDSSKSGKERKKHLQHIIEQNREESLLGEKWSELYYQDILANDPWLEKLNNLREKEGQLRADKISKEVQITRKEQEISACDPTIDLDGLQKRMNDSKSRLLDLSSKEGGIEVTIKENKDQLKYYKELRDQLRRKEGVSEANLKREIIASDIMWVLSESQRQLRKLVRKDLGESISKTFREMTLQDEETANYSKVIITDDYDLRVVSRITDAAVTLDQVNGSALRALTMSFVMALINNSDHKAPVLIDNPGASSAGDIKKAIIRDVINNIDANQTILFLYRDEIEGVEEDIHRHADKKSSQYTISHPKGYPLLLKNKVKKIKGLQSMVRCECDIDSSCQTCELVN